MLPVTPDLRYSLDFTCFFKVAIFAESMTIVASRAASVLLSVARKQAVPTMVRPVGDVRFRPRQGCLRGLLLLPAPLLGSHCFARTKLAFLALGMQSECQAVASGKSCFEVWLQGVA